MTGLSVYHRILITQIQATAVRRSMSENVACTHGYRGQGMSFASSAAMGNKVTSLTTDSSGMSLIDFVGNRIRASLVAAKCAGTVF
jgi:hypothetical protein